MNTERQMTIGHFDGVGELRGPSVINVVRDANTVMSGTAHTIQ